LKSTTLLAETLGHLKYSLLIQDCFYDLNEIAAKHEAQIYQYIGDEAVLSWPYEKGVAHSSCIDLFFAFQQKVQSKASYYHKKYNILPEFKAGLHGGALMVTEVGVVKKELAYHGDVINTAARIQAQCNANNVPILISERLLADLDLGKKYISRFIGKVLLKGKGARVNIHTLKLESQENTPK